MTEVKHKMYTLKEVEKAAELWYGLPTTLDEECLAENRLNNGEEHPSSVANGKVLSNNWVEVDLWFS